jgi:hypothetical protein
LADTKICNVCNKALPLIDFNINKQCKGGREHRCKHCKRIQLTVTKGCLKCGKDFKTTNKNTKYCSQICRGSLGRQYSYSEVLREINSRGFVLLTETYINNHQKLHVECSCGKEVSMSFKSILEQGRCKYCYHESVRARRAVPPTNKFKKCLKCNISKPFKEFNKHSGAMYGLNPVCKECKKNGDIKEISCKKCGKDFFGLIGVKYCSDKCRGYTPEITLDNAKSLFKAGGCELLATVYVNNRTKMPYICECGNPSFTTYQSFKDGVRCWDCRNKGLSRENNPNWNPSKSDEDRIRQRKYKEYTQWRTAVYERDNYTCVCCGKIGGDMNAHHLDGYHWCVERRTDITNGVTLCEECHTDFHAVKGSKNNTEQQYFDWADGK